MEVRYTTNLPIPPAALNTEITTYLWPGFLGEFDHTTLVFTTWELVGPTQWRPRPDLVAPPFDCMGQCTIPSQVWRQGPEHWICQGSVARCLSPPG
jgi:hypothetical protein